MKFFQRFGIFALIFIIFLALVFPNTADLQIYAGAMVASNTTIGEGQTKNYDSGVDLYGFSSSITFQNYGTVNINANCSMYNTIWNNEGTLNFTGSSDSSTFALSGTSSFTNNGTVTIKGVYNFGVQTGTNFINNGILFLEDVKNYNLDSFVNYGTVVIADDTNPYLALALEQKTQNGGSVFTKTQFENKTVNYSITYELNANSEVTNDNPYLYEYALANPQDVHINNASRHGYRFLGWTGLDITTPTPDFTFSSTIQKNVFLTAHWEPEIYNITYELNGGSFYTYDKDNVKYNYTIEDENYLLPRPYKDGYTFIGWTGSNDTIPSDSVYIKSNSTGDKSFTANFIANTDTKYHVVCYYQNIDGTYEEESHLFSAETNQTVQASADDYAKKGFSFDAENSMNLTSGTVMANNSLTLKLYYSRNKYTVTYKTQDGSETLWTAERIYGEEVGEYGGTLPEKQSDNDLYTYVFDQWARYENLDFGIDMSDFPVYEDITFYAAFEKIRDESIVIVRWEEHEGFEAPEKMEVRLKKGETYEIALNLVNENYYIGTKEWSFPTFAVSSVLWNDPPTGDHSLEYTVDCEGFGKPILLTIPKIEHDIRITLNAHYHEEHDYSPSDDTIIVNGGCVTDSVIRHFCYKCGKTEDETVSGTGHILKDKFISDDISHWKICRICNSTVELTPHTTDGGIITLSPTHTSTGTKTYSCTVCHHVLKRESLPMVAHIFPEEWQIALDAHYKICECGTRMQEVHLSDNGIVTVPPSNSQPGTKTYACQICGFVMRTESIPATGGSSGGIFPPVPSPTPTTIPIPTFVPTPEVTLTPTPVPTATPTPTPTPPPTPMPDTEPTPTQLPKTEPTPTPETEPTLTPSGTELTPTPITETKPTLTPTPTPTMTMPTTVPSPTSVKKPTPAPTLVPDAKPTTKAGIIPSPTPSPTETAPTPTPMPTAGIPVSNTPVPTTAPAIPDTKPSDTLPPSEDEMPDSSIKDDTNSDMDVSAEPAASSTRIILPIVIVGIMTIIIIILLLRRKKQQTTQK